MNEELNSRAQQTNPEQSVIEIEGNIWVGDAADPMNGEVVLESERCAVVVERTDVDEIAVHATLPGDDNAVVSVYLSRVAALALAKLLELDSRS